MYSISLILFTALAALLSSARFTEFLAAQDFWEKLCCTIDNTCDVETEIDENGFLRQSLLYSIYISYNFILYIF